jgi:hypothetical protein
MMARIRYANGRTAISFQLKVMRLLGGRGSVAIFGARSRSRREAITVEPGLSAGVSIATISA